MATLSWSLKKCGSKWSNDVFLDNNISLTNVKDCNLNIVCQISTKHIHTGRTHYQEQMTHNEMTSCLQLYLMFFISNQYSGSMLCRRSLVNSQSRPYAKDPLGICDEYQSRFWQSFKGIKSITWISLSSNGSLISERTVHHVERQDVGHNCPKGGVTVADADRCHLIQLEICNIINWTPYIHFSPYLKWNTKALVPIFTCFVICMPFCTANMGSCQAQYLHCATDVASAPCVCDSLCVWVGGCLYFPFFVKSLNVLL